MKIKISETEWAIRKAQSKERLRKRRRAENSLALKRNVPRRLYRSAKQRAKQKGLEFTIKTSDVIVPTHCPVLGIELKVAFGAAHGRGSSPSLDRIDNRLGYVPGNIVVMSNRANKLKSDATAEELRLVAAWALENQFD